MSKKREEVVSNAKMAETQVKLVGEILKREMSLKDILDKDTRVNLEKLSEIGELYVKQCEQQDLILSKLDHVLDQNESLLRRTQMMIGQNYNLAKSIGEA